MRRHRALCGNIIGIVLATGLIGATLGAGCAQPAPSPAAPSSIAGATLAVALTPRHFPNSNSADFDDMFARVSEVGAGAIIFNWDQSDLHTAARNTRNWSRNTGIPVLMTLNPTALSPRGQILLPNDVSPTLDGQPSFEDPAIQSAYLDDVERLAELHPPYLGLATEVNLVVADRPDQLTPLASLCAAAYDRVKAASPETRVFVSFYWDDIYRVTDGDADPDTAELINAFRDNVDVIGLSTYPANHWSTPAEVPNDLYTSLAIYGLEDMPIIVSEVGWPTAGVGNESEQVEFLQRAATLFEEVAPDYFAWSLLHDVPTSIMPQSLATTGLRTNDGRAKTAWTAYLHIR